MSWTLNVSDLPSDEDDFLSAIFTIGNGLTCTRGTRLDDGLETYRGMYVSGLYTRAGYGLNYFLSGPDWLAGRVRIGEQDAHCTEAKRALHLDRGLLAIAYRYEAGEAAVEIREERLCAMHDPTLLAQRIEVKILQSEEPVELLLGIDGDVRNHRAKYFKPGQLPNSDEYGLKLSRIDRLLADDGSAEVVLRSPQTGRRIVMGAAIRQLSGPTAKHTGREDGGLAGVAFRLAPDSDGRTCAFTKLCRFVADIPGYSSADDYQSRDVLGELRANSYTRISEAHRGAWQDFWKQADVEIDGNSVAQRAVRYAIWSTRIAAPDNGGASSVGAKNLAGDWYRGAVFWDMEMYQLPLLAAVAPELAKNHILYRYNRLDAARTLAAQDGYEGARFPWHSYTTGLEEPPAIGGFLYQQVHLNVAVPYGVLHYFDLTADRETMLPGGLEILLEQCRFWVSRTERDEDGRYHIRNVCGPDEVHKSVDDNAYTNLMVAHVLRRTDELISELSATHANGVNDVLTRCGLEEDERQNWLDVAENLYVARLDGAFAQFAGFEDYAEPSNRQRQQEGGGTDKTNKQADTLMLFQALPQAFDRQTQEANFDVYAPLCNQTSSLSMCTHALIAARLGRQRDAMRYFEPAAGVDLLDSYGNTRHGIHGAGEGGIWMAIVHGLGGLTVGPDRAEIAPRLPDGWARLRYRFLLAGRPIDVQVTPEQVEVTNRGQASVELTVCGEAKALQPHQPVACPHEPDWQPERLAATVFDLDGVLVKTDHLHYQAWKELADELGLSFDEQVNHQLRGVSREESLRIIYRHNDKPAPEGEQLTAQCTRKNERYKQLIGEMTDDDVLPGARKLLEGLKAEGVKVAVASASKNAPRVLERTGLGELLDAVVDGSAVTQSKPSPQGFHLASQRLRVLPWDCIGIEDAESGIEAIRRAGMLAVGVGEHLPEADMNVTTVEELSAEKLMRLFCEADNPTNPYLEKNVAKMKSEEA